MKFSINNLIAAIPIKYYQIPFDGTYFRNESELIDLLEEKLIKAVERQNAIGCSNWFLFIGWA